jgi:hypothetical protein
MQHSSFDRDHEIMNKAKKQNNFIHYFQNGINQGKNRIAFKNSTPYHKFRKKAWMYYSMLFGFKKAFSVLMHQNRSVRNCWGLAILGWWGQ